MSSQLTRRCVNAIGAVIYWKVVVVVIGTLRKKMLGGGKVVVLLREKEDVMVEARGQERGLD